MSRLLRLASATAALLALTGCATTSHHYSASDSAGIRIGDARITSGISVGVTPAGVYVTPRLGYYHARAKSQ